MRESACFWISFGLEEKQGGKSPQKHCQIAQKNDDRKQNWTQKGENQCRTKKKPWFQFRVNAPGNEETPPPPPTDIHGKVRGEPYIKSQFPLWYFMINGKIWVCEGVVLSGMNLSLTPYTGNWLGRDFRCQNGLYHLRIQEKVTFVSGVKNVL